VLVHDEVEGLTQKVIRLRVNQFLKEDNGRHAELFERSVRFKVIEFCEEDYLRRVEMCLTILKMLILARVGNFLVEVRSYLDNISYEATIRDWASIEASLDLREIFRCEKFDAVWGKICYYEHASAF
jgi:hypothetical protein